jgi:repressor LexA
MNNLQMYCTAEIPLDFRSLFANTIWERFSTAMALTRRQKEVMDFLADFIDRNGYSPSYEEIASGLGLASLATVHKHIQALESKQYLAAQLQP